MKELFYFMSFRQAERLQQCTGVSVTASQDQQARMVYVNKGSIVEQHSVWRWSIVSDFLWAVVGAWVFFWQTLVTADAAQSSHSRKVPPTKKDGKGRGPSGSRVTGMSSLQDHDNAGGRESTKKQRADVSSRHAVFVCTLKDPQQVVVHSPSLDKYVGPLCTNDNQVTVWQIC